MDKLEIGLVVVALVAVGGAAWYVTKKPVVSTPGTVAVVSPGGSGVLTSGSNYGNQSGFQQSSGPSSQDVLNQLKAQQEAEQRRLRDLEIRAFQDRIALVENAQAVKISEIDSVDRDQTGLANMIKVVESEITTSCYNKHHGEWFNGEQQCREKNLPDASNPAISWSGHARWEVEKKRIKYPLEQKLKELEVQYKGMVQELQTRFSITYNPSQPNAHARAAQV
jgi:hypothetical protein